VDVARYFLAFTQRESCGKCPPCRLGTKQMLAILEDICAGKGQPSDLDLLTELAETVQAASLCALGQTAPNPVLSTLRYFSAEYDAHINERRCPAGVCRELIHYTILEDKCTACGRCKRECPEQCISGEKKVPHKIDQSRCIKCGLCYEVCKFAAVEVK
jgi:NADP-reducing hydrogenase subunit HndC